MLNQKVHSIGLQFVNFVPQIILMDSETLLKNLQSIMLPVAQVHNTVLPLRLLTSLAAFSVQFTNSPSPALRMALVGCCLAMHQVLGDALFEHMAVLTPAHVKLIKIMVRKH